MHVGGVHGAELVLSATDLSNFLGCRHRTALDIEVAFGARQRPYVTDPLLEVLWERGREHERRYVEQLRRVCASVVDLTEIGDPVEHVAATIDAMRLGVDAIVQGALSDGQWFGKPDVLRRVPGASRFGDWSYEIADTKLARDTRSGTIIQLGLYSEMLMAAQGASPGHFHVVTPDPLAPVRTYRVDDYAAYVRLIRRRMLDAVALGAEALAAENYPEPVAHCEICHWFGACADKRRADDHLSLVAGITRVQRRELEAQRLSTLTALAALPVPLPFKPKRGSREAYARVREQARLQLESRGKVPPLYELLAVEPEKGFCRMPEPSPGDLFLDLEGDPFVGEEGQEVGGREYLFGVATANGEYHALWALTQHDERRAFEWIIDMIGDTARDHPGMHVYHYSPYEPSAFKRLMGRYATRERELDAMLRAGRFVDLYAVVRQGLRAGVEKYSIKNLEPLYGFTRVVPLSDANRGLKAMEHALEAGVVDALPASIRETVEAYNRDDCVSTLRLRDWLERARDELVARGVDVPRKMLAEGEAPPSVDERARAVEAVRARLLDGIPEQPADRDNEQQARWLLAYMLDYHRREDKAKWWEFFRLCELAEEDLHDEREAVAGLELVERLGPVISAKTGRATRSVRDRYRYPPQEMEIDPGDEVRLQDQRRFGRVVAVDRANLTIDVEKGPAVAEAHPAAMFAFADVPSKVQEGALLRIGESVASARGGYGAAWSLLTAATPRLRSGPFVARAEESAVDFAVRIVGDLDETVLPIQGPPGAGKTFCGARMICALVEQGKRVGVTAGSHKVIRNLLDAVAAEAERRGAPVRLAHKPGEGDEYDDSRIQRIHTLATNEEALAAIQSGSANVVGGTAWLWSREEFGGAVDVLFIDEAGQMALANALAVSQAANSVVLLGDPQQLEQPRRGSHPDGVGVSALEHVLQGHQTVPSERGIFLPETWRLSPAICAFTSEVFYEQRLTARPGLERQRLIGVGGSEELPASGLALVLVDHDGNRHVSTEEVDRVEEIVARLINEHHGATWIDAAGTERPITGSDVLVVAPYNAQVNRLAERLARFGVPVGTVDKFQGQEAPVVIYSMATSRPEDAPRGMEFLYSLNRLNVATSRARAVAIVVASPRLFEPECRAPHQMRLANALCRFREMAVVSQDARFAAVASPTLDQVATANRADALLL
jgi:uncharacterized protein